jgi:hypothetical protein
MIEKEQGMERHLNTQVECRYTRCKDKMDTHQIDIQWYDDIWRRRFVMSILLQDKRWKGKGICGMPDW